MYNLLLFLPGASAFVTSNYVKFRITTPYNGLAATNKTLEPLFFPEAGEPGPLENYAEYMGFGPAEKWKAVRYSVYAMAVGYLLSETLDIVSRPLTEYPFV